MKSTIVGLGDTIRRQAILGSKIAFQDTVRAVTFAEFEQRVDALVDALFTSGARPGDRVAVLSPNSVNVAECIAASRAGLIIVPLNWRLSSQELTALLQDCAPTVLICDETWSKIADAQILPYLQLLQKIVFGEQRSEWLSYESIVASGNPTSRYLDAALDDVALLVYTSGTTGAPKAAMVSHLGLSANGVASASEAIGVSEKDKILCVMPMFHVGGLCYYLLPSYMAGATSVLRPMFEVNDLVSSLDLLGITNVHLVPTMLADLIAHPNATQAASRLKRIVYAGSSMPVALLERAMSVLKSCSFSQSYGSTESGIVTTLGPNEHRISTQSAKDAHLLKSCGRPLSATDIRVVDDNGIDCPIGKAGEVLVQSERIMAGYWNQPEKTSATFLDHHVCTGDIGYRDEQGYLYLVDRKGDMIVTGGENVFPSEVEQVLYRCPDIAEVSVFGVFDARWIEKVVAAVVLLPGSQATPDSIIEYAKKNLASYKCPKTIHVVTELPRTGVGKISRKHLRLLYGPRE